LRRPSDFLLFLSILAFTLVVPLLLRLKLSTLEKLLEPRKPPLGADDDVVQRLSTFINEFVRLAGPLFHSICLTRGLTLYYYLRKAGLDVSLCFGIGSVNDAFVGHCWIVRDGVPYMERHDPRSVYTPMYSIPQSSIDPEKRVLRMKDLVLGAK
jgi:hypothetical protein